MNTSLPLDKSSSSEAVDNRPTQVQIHMQHHADEKTNIIDQIGLPWK